MHHDYVHLKMGQIARFGRLKGLNLAYLQGCGTECTFGGTARLTAEGAETQSGRGSEGTKKRTPAGTGFAAETIGLSISGLRARYRCGSGLSRVVTFSEDPGHGMIRNVQLLGGLDPHAFKNRFVQR